MQRLIPVTTLVATFSNDFVRRLPGAHALCGTTAKNRTCDCTTILFPIQTLQDLSFEHAIDMIKRMGAVAKRMPGPILLL